MFHQKTDLTTGKSISYAELAKIINQTSSSLRRRGFRPCDVVAIMAANHLEVPIIFFAAWKAGGGCSALIDPDDIRSRIIETRASFIVTDEQRADKVLQAIQGLNMQAFVIGQAEGYTAIDQLLQDDGQGHFFFFFCRRAGHKSQKWWAKNLCSLIR